MCIYAGVGRKKLNREKFQITLPAGMPAAMERAAHLRGWDRSRLFEELAARFLAEEAERIAAEKPAKKGRKKSAD